MKKPTNQSKEMPPCGKRYALCEHTIVLGQENRGFDSDPNNGVLVTYYMTECGGFFVQQEARYKGEPCILTTSMTKEEAIDLLENTMSDYANKLSYMQNILNSIKPMSPRKNGGR